MGLPTRDAKEFKALSDGIEESAIAKKYYDDPLVNIIKFACNACPEKKVFVTNAVRDVFLISVQRFVQKMRSIS
jgi:hypothetical protein